MKTKGKHTAPSVSSHSPAPSPVANVTPTDVEGSRVSDASKPLVWLTALFGVLAPILYTIDYLFSSGYSNALGLEPDLYARSPDQHIAKSISTLARIIVDFFPNLSHWVISIIVLFLGFTVLVWINHVLSKRLRTPKWLANWKDKVSGTMGQKSWRAILVGFLTSYLLIYLPIAMAFAMLLIFAPISDVGARSALSMIDDFNTSGKCSGASSNRRARCVLIAVGKERPFEALLLLASDKAVSVYDPNERAVRSLQLKDGIEIRTVIRDPLPPKRK
jgi:hypothetical protein